MNRRVRFVVFGIGAVGVGVLFLVAAVGLPAFGGSVHPYRDLAVAAAAAHATANVVGSVNFDQRAMDTLGEEVILIGSVLGATALLREGRSERQQPVTSMGRILPSTALLGYALLPLTLVVGLDVMAHGHLTPGGGFQGGVVLGTGLHLLYVAGSYQALERLRPVPLFELGEAVGGAAFACLGIAGAVVSTGFLANLLPHGTFGSLLSGGTVPLLNIAVGIEVASSVVVLLAEFLTQAFEIRERSDARGQDAGTQETGKAGG